MKRILKLFGTLLGLLALAALVVILTTTLRDLRASPQPASQVFQSPIETPTQPPYPPPGTPTRPTIPTIPPTVTQAPKPSPSPSPIPTATPIPTPLPLPPSAFYALWAENYPEGQGSVLWLADPRDIGSRREVLRFERDRIIEAALSPNGRRLALITTYWKTSTLWIANVDGTDLQQLDQSIPLGIRNLVWSRDSSMLAYNGVTSVEATFPDKAGTPVTEPTLMWTIELLDPSTGRKQHLLQVDPHEDLSIIGWSADNRELYYIRSMPQYKLWAIELGTRKSREITVLGHELILPVISPDGSKFLIHTPEGLAWISATGKVRQDIPTPHFRQLCGYFWSPYKDEVVLCEVSEQQPIEHIKVFNVQSGAMRVLSSVIVSYKGLPLSPLAMSPDMQWIVASVYQDGMYWVHLPTGIKVPVPTPDQGAVFHVAWVPKPGQGGGAQ